MTPLRSTIIWYSPLWRHVTPQWHHTQSRLSVTSSWRHESSPCLILTLSRDRHYSHDCPYPPTIPIVTHCPTEDMAANILTKALLPWKVLFHCNMLTHNIIIFHFLSIFLSLYVMCVFFFTCISWQLVAFCPQGFWCTCADPWEHFSSCFWYFLFFLAYSWGFHSCTCGVVLELLCFGLW